MAFRWLNVGPDATARRFLLAALGWLVPAVGFRLANAIQLVWPGIYHGILPLGYGRLEAAAYQALIFGWLSCAGFAFIHYAAPRYLGAPLSSERLGAWTFWLWNAGLGVGVLALLGGWSEGRPFAELAWPFDLALAAALFLAAVNVARTAATGGGREVHVAALFLVAAPVWFFFLYIIGNATFVRAGGLGDAVVAAFYREALISLWLVPVAFAFALAAVPRAAGRPLDSKSLAYIGFWGLAVLGGLLGARELMLAPVPEWAKGFAAVVSGLWLIPLTGLAWTVLSTLRGAWERVVSDLPLRWTVVGLALLVLWAAQAAFFATRWIGWYVAFTAWPAVALRDLALWGGVGFVTTGIVLDLYPRLVGRPWLSGRLLELHFWFSAAGLGLAFWSLVGAGLVQAALAAAGAPAQHAVVYLKPHFSLRALGIAGLALGQGLLLYHAAMAARQRAAAAAAHPASPGTPAEAGAPAVAEGGGR